MGKLTLKLKSTESKDSLLHKKSEKKSSSSKVEVTIKGRKRRSGGAGSKDGLTKREFARRRDILKNLERGEKGTEVASSTIDTSNILSKINKVASAEASAEKAKRERIEERKRQEQAELEESRRQRDERVARREAVKRKEYEETHSSEKKSNVEESSKSRQSGVNVHSLLSKNITKKKKFEKPAKTEDKKKEEVSSKPQARSDNDSKKFKKKGTFKDTKKTQDDKSSFDEKKKKPKTSSDDEFKGKKKTKKTFFTGSKESEENKRYIPARFRRVKRKDKNKQKNQSYEKIAQEITLPEFITVGELAERMNEQKGVVIKKLFTMGTMVTVNQTIDADTAELIAEEFGHKVTRVSESDVENILMDINDESLEQKGRMPVVTIMGHVDHGKTSLLDAIRSTNVTAGESGGITQHIGASRVYTDNKREKFITFIDTPGHEAFTEMRMRGADVTDIVILVVAADDGVKEQTIEAISHTKAAGVPMIVAINKIDKPGAEPSRVKNELLAHNVVSEDLGGDIMFVEVSAKQRLNLEGLMETIMLQAEILELKAAFEGDAKGAIIETRVDPKKGVITTLLVQKGTLHVGDLIIAGTTSGKVRKMTDDKGKNQNEAIPSMAAEVLGLDKAPQSGDTFAVLKDDKKVREIIAYRERKAKEEKAAKSTKGKLEDMFKNVGKGVKKILPVIIKADVHGSVEAIAASLVKINSEEVEVNIIHSATGGVTESDVKLASVSNALIVGFNVRASSATMESAKNQGVEIRYYSIIYNVIDEVKAILSGMLEPIKKEEKLGQAEIRQVFKITGAGTVAGSYVTDGMMLRNARARLLRDHVVIHDGKIKALKRQKDDVKEVKHNFECGILLENYNDIKVGDIVEAYKVTEEARTLA